MLKETTMKINFYNPRYDIEYTYNPITKSYTRLNGGLENALHPKNVLVLEIPILGEGEYGRLDIDMTGEGPAYLFRDGRVMKGMWRKSAENLPFIFEDMNGHPMKFANGQTWMTVMHTLERLSWE